MISGTVYNGLWDGNIIWAFEETDGTLSYPVTFDKGKALVLRYEEDDGDAVISEGTLESGEDDGVLVNDYLTDKEGIVGFSETV